ncbi:phospholipase D-like domain-containing protein [Halopseudomonas pelagia]|uniref:phospholipase D-like domain-containing protein n=1 Tax=Halopseudomonas pelagia TaxID=553151 RepID=UPI001C549942|nr:phospholipase D-like domain-containing protein [Halopseudomonas pelagia]
MRPLPESLSIAPPLRDLQQAELLIDQTYVTSSGERVSEQQVFDEVLRLIAQARKLVLVDMFLFNDFAGKDSYRPLSAELTTALVQAREQYPQMPVVLITDPFNTLYGGIRNGHLEQLQAAGVSVVMTDLSQLPASNPAWTGIWTLCCSYLGNSAEGGWLPNPVGEGKVTLRSYLHLINFRANHRKTLVVDEGDNWTGLVTSGNPHDASSRHSNNALRFSGAAALDLLASEIAVLRFSSEIDTSDWPAAPAPTATTDSQLQVLTEAAIRDALLRVVDSAQPGDELDLEVFYFSHRPLIEALIRAQQRGVQLRVLMDANRDAFGREKNGVPNRQVAWDLHEAGIDVRWCATQGEQCHRKWLRLDRADGRSELITGSANFTRRNLDDLNLETSVRLLAPAQQQVMQAAREQFERSWSNPNGEQHSLPYAKFADHSRWRYGLYRFMEFSGVSTF